MSQDFHLKLESLLKKDPRFIDQEGDLLKNNVIDATYKADDKLIESLLSKKEFKDKFFSKVKNVYVFNINDFVTYIQDKNFLADSYTKYRNKVGLNIDGRFLNERKEVALVWPFKDCFLEGGMTKEDEKRKEIFFNEILAQDEIDKLLSPKVLIKWKRYSKKGEEEVKELKRDENGIIRENLIIKGNNLLALHSLKHQFQDKIKLIYIDPPYNTGNDSFGYNDNFNHSAWLTFMKNRLEVARELLRDDGVIFIQCDNNEQAYLKVLMDEVFGRDNFISNITWERSATAGLGLGGKIINVSEFLLVYSKDSNNKNLLNSEVFKPMTYSMDDFLNYKILRNKGEKTLIKKYKSSTGQDIRIFKHDKYLINKVRPEDFKDNFDKIFRTFLIQKENSFQHSLIFQMDKKSLYSVEYTPSRGKNKGRLTTNYYYNKELFSWLNNLADYKGGKVIKFERVNDFWDRRFISNAARGEGGIKGIDRMKKPEKLISFIIELSSKPGDLVLDYHLGTGTTASVAHKMNRQYIGIEQMDYVEDWACERILNTINGDQGGISQSVNWKGGGDFIYCELMKYNELFVDKIKKTKDTKELLKIWEEMKAKSFLNYNVDIKKFDESIDEFKKLPFVKQQRTLFDLLNKNQLYVNLNDIDDKEFGLARANKLLNKRFYEQEN
jgi:adenine-specific DNA-methyltransferase